MAGIMENLGAAIKDPNTFQWLGNVGAGLSRAGRGQGFDISEGNAQFFQGLQNRVAKGKLAGMMDQFNLSPQQRAIMENLPLEAQQKILAGQAFPQGGESTAMIRNLEWIKQNHPAEYAEAARHMMMGGGGAPAVWEQKRDTMIGDGMDPATANKIATGQWVISRNPINGQSEVIDKATGRPVNAGGGGNAGAPPPPAAMPSPLYGEVDKATGLIPGLKALSTDILGQLPDDVGGLFSFPDTVESRQTLDVATNDLIRSLSINPKFPVAETKRIIEEIGIKPGVATSATTLKSNMRSLDRYLRNRAEFEREAAADPNLPAEDRQMAIASARNIDQFLNLLGVPQEGATQQQQFTPDQYGSVPQYSPEIYESLSPGDTYRAPNGQVYRKK